MADTDDDKRRDEILKRMLKTPPQKREKGRDAEAPRPSSESEKTDKRRKPE